MKRALPDGDPSPADGTDVGALWRDDTHERLVRFVNDEDSDNYEVEVLTLDGNGVLQVETRYWRDGRIAVFTASDQTAYLAGHNAPGVGVYGVFVDDYPECPGCSRVMTPGTPAYDSPDARIGLTCKEYDLSHGVHDGYMTQDEAIEAGYYITAETYFRRRYGGEDA